MTKTELKNQGVDEMRETLSEHFEGITEDTTKAEMKDLIDENWDDFLNEALNPDSEDEPEEDLDLDDEEEPGVTKNTDLGYGPR